MGLGAKNDKIPKYIREVSHPSIYRGEASDRTVRKSSDPTAEKACRGGGSHEGCACEGAAGGL